MKNILFLLAKVAHVSTGQGMYADLIREFHRLGHRVTVAAASRAGEPTGVYDEGGIRVLRIRLPALMRFGFAGKGLAQALLPLYYTRALMKHPEMLPCDLVITPTPPISLGSVVTLVKKTSGAQAYLILRDFVAQGAVDLKMVRRGGPVHRWLRSQEHSLLAACDSIGCMSPANVECAHRLYPQETRHKCHVLQNFLAAVPQLVATDLDRAEFGLGNEFLVVYGGNMGRPQRLENILELALRCKDLTDVRFFLLGDGTERDRLTRQVTARQLRNVSIAPPLDPDRYRRLLTLASLGIISLHENLSVPSHPSKIIGYLSQGLPVLASLNKDNDLGHIIDRGGWGMWAPAGDVAGLESCLRSMYANRDVRNTMSRKALECSAQEHGVTQACETILRMTQGTVFRATPLPCAGR